MATLDFVKLSQDGISKKAILDFVKNNQNNFNYQELEDFYKQEGFSPEQITNALYNDLVHFDALDFAPIKPKEQTPTKPIPQESPHAPIEKDLSPAQLEPKEFIPLLPENAPTGAKSPELRDPKEALAKIQEKAKALQANSSWLKQALSTLDYVKDDQQRQENLAFKDLVQSAIAHNIAYEQLPAPVQDFLARQQRAHLSAFNPLDWGEIVSGVFSGGKDAYTQEKTRQSILQVKDPNKLTKEQRHQIYKDRNFLENITDTFGDPKKVLKEYQDFLKSADLTKEVQKSVFLFKDKHSATSLSALLTGASDEQKQDYAKGLEAIAKANGFEGAYTDKEHNIYMLKDGQYYRVNDGFIDNFLNFLQGNMQSIAGGIVGAHVGAQIGAKTRTPWGFGASVVAGSALGTSLGSALDYLYTDLILKRQHNFEEMKHKALEDGTLSLVADAATLGLAKVLRPLARGLKNANWDQITNYIPGVNWTKSFLTGNRQSIENILNNSLSAAEQAAIKAAGEEFGGGVLLGRAQIPARETMKKTFGEGKIFKAYETLMDAFFMNNKQATQEGVLRAVRADEEGTLLAFMAEAANASPKAQKALKDILNTTTQKLQAQLQKLDVSQSSIQSILDHLQRGTQQSYQQATEEIIAKLYPRDTKIQLDPKHYRAFRKELEEDGLLKQEAMPFLEFVENNIYREGGVHFNQLSNALKNLNSKKYYKDIKDPGLEDYLKRAVQQFLKTDVKEGIDKLFASKPALAKDIAELYNTTLKDYAHMKETLKIAKRLGLRDEFMQKDAVADRLLNALKGQEGDSNHLDKLHLNPSQREATELHILNRLFEKSLLDEEALKVFDSQDFFKQVQKIGQDTFKSQAAKDFLDMASGFHRLFKNDAKIARMLAPARTERIGASIATSVSGAFKHQITKELFAFLTRLVPRIPFATRINEKVSGEVLTHAIKQALLKSHTIQDFSKNIQSRAVVANFDNDTKRLIKSWTQQLEQGAEQIGAKERAYEVITDKEAFIQDLDLSVNATPIPASLDVEGFLKSLEGVENKENFIKHLQDKGTQEQRLAYLNLVEPTLKTPDIELFFKDPEKKEYIKAFKKENGKDLTYLLVTADGDRLLLTGLPVRQKSYLERQIRDADIIHSFIQPGRLDTQGGLTPSGLPTKDSTTSPLLTDLSPQEIQEAVKKWDLASPKETDVLDFALVKDPELTELKEVFNTDKLTRQLRATEVKESLDKGFSLEEVLDYTSHLPTAQRNILGDELHYTKPLENGKTLNIVETYKAPKTLRFSRMDVVEDRRMPPPKGDIEGTNPKGDVPQNPSTDTTSTKGGIEEDTSPKGNIEDTGTDFKAIAHELYTKAQEQESGFKELLGTLKQANNRIEGGNTLKTLESLEEKLAYYKGDTDKVNDSLRGAVVTDKEGFNEALTQVLESLENNPSVSHISPKFIKTQDGYTGAHINFNFNGVPSEIQLHTPKSWEIKKQLDPLYKAKRRLQLERKLTNKDLRDFKRKMKALGQESDLDISLLTSFKLTSPQASSAMSVLSKKSGTELNESQDHLLKSNSNPGTSESGNAYNRLESKLNQKSTSLTGGKGIDTDIQTPLNEDTTTPLKIEANPEFGENFAEYAGKGAEAVKKLLQEKRGQVSGAFYREGLGYIDIIWGSAGGMGDKAKGVGLSKILEKHIDDFTPFQGDTPQEKLINGLSQIVQNGELVINSQDVKTIILKKGGKEFRAGLSQGWDGQGKNHWIITAYELKHPPLETSDQSRALVGHGNNLAQKDLGDSTTTPLKGKSRLQQALEAQQRELEAKEAQLKAKALEDKENAAK
ncbi:hypothetical protein, partial [Helicobacter ailurogastricus]|uniref:putative barnase/colicin E5 family endoribonuclease n=2 Tax=Helicobacter ailurogastricus TaxID=1578720 RepID=UPI0006B448D0